MADGGQGRARPPLTREQVLQAALALADAGGIASLSMRKLGVELGVEAMSLYHHVANKEEMLDAMVDAVFAEIELPGPPTSRLARRRCAGRGALGPRAALRARIRGPPG